jgi:hypothetical protein
MVDDYNAGARWVFYLRSVLLKVEGRILGLSIWVQSRGARLLAVVALSVSALIASATARSSANGDVPEKKTANAKTTARKHKAPATRSKSTSKTHTGSAGKRSSRKKGPRGQQKIDSERAQAIQEALIREHYLTGEATGTWNQASEEAMRRYQTDQGWQNKTVPDSRALIKLGLGPSKDHLLNPESAMTTVPDSPRAEPMPTSSHTAAPMTGSVPVPASDANDSSHPQ